MTLQSIKNKAVYLKMTGCPGQAPGMTSDRHSGTRVSANPESRDSPMCNCTSWFDAPHRPGMTIERSHPALQRVADFFQHLGILDGGRHRPLVAVGDLLDGAAQDLAGTGLRQPADGDRELERGDRAELVAHQRHDLLFDCLLYTSDAA